MNKKIIGTTFLILILGISFVLLYFRENKPEQSMTDSNSNHHEISHNEFLIDQVYHSESQGEIHYSVFIPEDYTSEKSYPMYLTLPRYEGLYFQGIGVNLEYEDFASEAQKINNQMIIVAPQLNDWGATPAYQTIALIEYFKEHYNINKVYTNGAGRPCLRLWRKSRFNQCLFTRQF